MHKSPKPICICETGHGLFNEYPLSLNHPVLQYSQEVKIMNQPEQNNKQITADKSQPKNVHVALSELCACDGSSKIYKYADWFAIQTKDNKLMTAIAVDAGYEPMLLYRDFLTDELNFTLENNYGLTNMAAEFTYHGNFFILEFDAECDAVYLSVDIKDEKIPKWFFDAVSDLKKIDIEKYKY